MHVLKSKKHDRNANPRAASENPGVFWRTPGFLWGLGRGIYYDFAVRDFRNLQGSSYIGTCKGHNTLRDFQGLQHKYLNCSINK